MQKTISALTISVLILGTIGVFPISAIAKKDNEDNNHNNQSQESNHSNNSHDDHSDHGDDNHGDNHNSNNNDDEHGGDHDEDDNTPPAPITCDAGFHIVNNVCTADTVTPPADPTCTTSQHLDNHVCVDNTVTPPVDTNPTPSTDTNSGGNTGGSSTHGGGHRHISGGEVLGASTGPACDEYIKTYIKLGGKNDAGDVKNLQTFLNEYMGANLPVTGFYGPETVQWVNKFQSMHDEAVLAPWAKAGLPTDGPTGYVYKTTKRWINLIKCPEMITSTPIPALN